MREHVVVALPDWANPPPERMSKIVRNACRSQEYTYANSNSTQPKAGSPPLSYLCKGAMEFPAGAAWAMLSRPDE